MADTTTTEADRRLEVLVNTFGEGLIARVNEFKRGNPEIGDAEIIVALTAVLAIGVVQSVEGDAKSIDPVIHHIAEQMRHYAHEQARGLAIEEASRARPN